MPANPFGCALTRRQVLTAMTAASAIAMSSSTMAKAADEVVLKWWDIYQPLIPLHKSLWAAYSKTHPVRVDYTGMNPSDVMQALQLAFRSNQAPDVFGVGSDPTALAALNQSHWFSPLDPSFKFDKPFQKKVLAEGFTQFGGKQYSFPIFTFRSHATSVWYFNDLMKKAGIDPDKGPGKWDTMRTVAKKLTGGNRYGLLLPLQFTDRIAEHLTELAMAAGAPDTIDWRTGEYAYASQPFIDALEFLLSFQKDGTLHPTSSAVDARQGRARWAAGEAVMFFDGSWNSGVLKNSFPQVIDKIGVSRLPYPDKPEGAMARRPPQPGTFFVSGQCKHVKQASDVLQLMTTEDYYIKLAEHMDQPPLDIDAVQKADVHPTYRKVVASFKNTVRLAPSPLIRNPDIAKVYAQMRTITPGLGEIMQGAFSGAFDNPKPMLQRLSDQMSAERDRAIAKAKQAGAKVSVDDWVFKNWKPDTDFTSDMY